jgi:uncharacterized protein (TIGR03083 family)
MQATTAVPVTEIPPLDHDEAMDLAETEYGRLNELVSQLRPQDWTRPTDCPGWDVFAVLAHLLGMMEVDADRAELVRQNTAAVERAAETGEFRIDALTALQVTEHAHLTPAELTAALGVATPAALAGRRAITAAQRAAVYVPGPPFNDPQWTLGYLMDVIKTRDPWMHRVDITRVTGLNLVLTPEHDGRLVADVVAEWARRHTRPFTLVLDGPAGGTYTSGEGGEQLRLDAVEFCRLLSGRGTPTGLLAEPVPF